jgi:hypothetical protein
MRHGLVTDAAEPLSERPCLRVGPDGLVANQRRNDQVPVRNDRLRLYLRGLLPGKWQEVIKKANTGDVHYFEHESGQVADVKFFPASSES